MDEDLASALRAFQRFTANDATAARKVAARRAQWATTRATVLDTFREVVRSAPTGDRMIYADHGVAYENLESVQLHFGKIPTGLKKQGDGSVSLGTELGAALVFGQSESGLVSAIRYPFMTELPGSEMRARQWEQVAQLEPSRIDRALVLELTVAFFEWAHQSTFRLAAAPVWMREAALWSTLLEGPGEDNGA